MLIFQVGDKTKKRFTWHKLVLMCNYNLIQRYFNSNKYGLKCSFEWIVWFLPKIFLAVISLKKFAKSRTCHLRANSTYLHNKFGSFSFPCTGFTTGFIYILAKVTSVLIKKTYLIITHWFSSSANIVRYISSAEIALVSKTDSSRCVIFKQNRINPKRVLTKKIRLSGNKYLPSAKTWGGIS